MGSWWQRKGATVRFTWAGTELSGTALEQRVASLSTSEQAQFGEVLGKVHALPSREPLVLALEAMTTRYVPRAPMASNVLMMDSARFWKRHADLEEARAHAAGVMSQAVPPLPVPAVSDEAAWLVKNAPSICWLLGAGISAAAGLPTVRGTGPFDDVKTQRARSMDHYVRHSDVAWVHADALRQRVAASRPTPAHLAILRRGGAVITLNVDGLEERAGIQALHLHGRVEAFHCLKEQADKPARDVRYNNAAFPICPDCGSLLKPGMLFFGEAMPTSLLDEAARLIASAQLLVEVGTSCAVTPVADLRAFARKRGLKVVAFNAETTPSPGVDVHVTGDVQAAFERFA
jgi:NAD-dependent deacetylase